MDADLEPTLRNHQIQLQQVLAALEADPENAELLEMRSELEEVIRLTKELLAPTGRSAASSDGPSSAASHRFKAGDKVQAPWSVDGLYYEATIEDVMSDGQCTVSFSASSLGQDPEGKHRKGTVSEVCLVSLLKPSTCSSGSSSKRPAAGGSSHAKSLSRESLKKKQQKRVLKQKELEEERERDKNKWQQFAQGKKAAKKKGLTSATGSKTRVSIFASPDGVDGRVGVGTCGISGLCLVARLLAIR